MSVEEHADWARARVTRMLGLAGTERVVAVLVVSLDGVVAVGGRSQPLSSDQDRALVGAWREAADALLVGVPSLSAEIYGGGLFTPQARARRLRSGSAAMAPVVTIDRSGSLDVDRALRAQEPLDLIAYVPTGAVGADRRVRWVQSDDLSLAGVLRDVRSRFGHRLIVAEPGPKLLKGLREERQVTDISLTVAPLLADQGPKLEPAQDAQPLSAVDVETVGAVTFVHLLAT